MHIGIFTIGKWKKGGLEQQLYEHFAKRCHWNLTLKEMNPLPHAQLALQQQQETSALLDAAKKWGAEQLIALDETGKDFTSRQFAEKLGHLQDNGIRHCGFIIGGDVGLDKSQLSHTHLTLRLGAMTWTHLLARALLAEQLYRAQCILANHPYHRD